MNENTATSKHINMKFHITSDKEKNEKVFRNWGKQATGKWLETQVASRFSKQCKNLGGSRDMTSKFWMKMIFSGAKLINSVMVEFSDKQGPKNIPFMYLQETTGRCAL